MILCKTMNNEMRLTGMDNGPLNSLWAKKLDDRWLPLTVHLLDTAITAKWLWENWLCMGVKRNIATGIFHNGDNVTMELAKRVLVFLACAHDLGKASPIFQAKPSFQANRQLDEILRERIRDVQILRRLLINFAYREYLAKQSLTRRFCRG